MKKLPESFVKLVDSHEFDSILINCILGALIGVLSRKGLIDDEELFDEVQNVYDLVKENVNKEIN